MTGSDGFVAAIRNLVSDAWTALFGLPVAAAAPSVAPIQKADEPIATLLDKAKQGDRSAQFDLALSLAERKPAAHAGLDYEEAIKWWREAAVRGDVRAQFNLSYLCATGRSVANGGKAEATKWLRIAAEARHASAQYVLAQVCGVRAYKLKKNGAAAEEISRELAEEVKWYEQAAQAGHVGAQCSLGYIFGDRGGLRRASRDSKACEKWYRRAADQGVVSAQLELGNMYATGTGVPQNLAEAARWYRAAIEQKTLIRCSLDAPENKLGYMYAVGEGVPLDFAEAAKLFGQAAKFYRWGREDEHYCRSYERRLCLQESIAAEATAWLCGAAENGWALGQAAIERMREHAARRVEKDRERWPGMMWFCQDHFWMGSLRDDSAIVGAFIEAAEHGDSNAQIALGFIGRPDTVERLQKAALQGSALAARVLGGMYEQGEGVSQDHDRAEIYYRVAAVLGDAVAQYEVGCAMFHVEITPAINSDDSIARLVDGAAKLGVLRDLIPHQKYVEAADWFERASEQGHAQAQCQLAVLCACGKGVPKKDQKRGATLFRTAAEQGYANAQFELAELYSSGTGVPKDRDEAMRWYRRAAECGHTLARGALGGFDFTGARSSQNESLLSNLLVNNDNGAA